jgi:enoyl-CoA hydratase
MSVVVDQPRPHVMRIRLDAPEVRNAISQAMAVDIEAAVTQCGTDPACKVLVITGTDPAFCAGVDLRDISAGRRVSMHFFDILADFPKPIIGAINGVAATGGFELALACHLRVGSPSSMFVDRHAQLGMVAGGGMSVRLSRLIGMGNALEISLTGRKVGSAEAFEKGLLNHVVEHEQLEGATLDLAETMATVDGELSRLIVGLYRENGDLSLAEALKAERAVADEWRDRRDRSGALQNFKALKERSG